MSFFFSLYSIRMRCGGISPRTERVNLPARIPYWLLPKMWLLLFEFFSLLVVAIIFFSIDRKFLVFVFLIFFVRRKKKLKFLGGLKFFFSAIEKVAVENEKFWDIRDDDNPRIVSPWNHRHCAHTRHGPRLILLLLLIFQIS